MNSVNLGREEAMTLIGILQNPDDEFGRESAIQMLHCRMGATEEPTEDVADPYAEKVAAIERHIVSMEQTRRMRYREMWAERCTGIWINRAKRIEMQGGSPGRTVTATFDVSPDDKSVVPDVETVSIGFTSPFMTVDDATVCLDELLNLLAHGWQETGKQAISGAA